MELKDLVLTLDKYVDDAVGKAKEHAQVARTHNVALVAYEGGQHLVGQGEMKEDEHLNRLFDKVQYDPGMKRAYLRYLEGWKHVGGSLFVAFAGVSPASKHGRWGAIENYGQTREQAPKYDALLTFIEKTPSWF